MLGADSLTLRDSPVIRLRGIRITCILSIMNMSTIALTGLLGLAFASLSTSALAASSQSAPDASTCAAVFDQTQPMLREDLRFRLQVSRDPEQTIDDYVAMVRRSYVGARLTQGKAPNAKRRVSKETLVQMQTPCYSFFSQDNFPDANALRFSRQQVFEMDERVDQSLLELVPGLRQVPIRLASLLRHQLPERFSEGLSLVRVTQKRGQVDLMLSTSQVVVDMYQEAVDRNPVQQEICKITLPHLTPQAVNLVTFTLIAPQDNVLGVFEAKNCTQ